MIYYSFHYLLLSIEYFDYYSIGTCTDSQYWDILGHTWTYLDILGQEIQNFLLRSIISKMTRKKGIKPKQSDPKKLSEDDLKYLKEKTDFDEKDIDEWFEEFIKVKVLSFHSIYG